MGAVHRYDLTPDVTHLIIANYATPKYRFVAKERPDVRPMTVRWIEVMRKLWCEDQEIDFEALELEHTLPTLATLKFSMTGCDDRKDDPHTQRLYLLTRIISYRKIPDSTAGRSEWCGVRGGLDEADYAFNIIQD
jgi:hypothetical protein